MRIERTTYACDACAAFEPVTRFDVPPGTPLTCLVDSSTGEGTLLKSAGALGLCGDCQKITERTGPLFNAPERRAKKLAQRIVEVNSTLSVIEDPQRRALILRALTQLWARLIPLLKNPRPCVRGEDPSDATAVWDDAPDEAPSIDPRSN